MTEQIAAGVLYLDRADWGADPAYPRLGGPDDPRNPGTWTFVPKASRTERIMHHTVIIDDDATPNLWESVGEAKGKMRQLQTIRPDLGLDVPYNDVMFFMADGTIIICEGRGLHRWGAHTIGHNDQIAVAIEGNTDLYIDMDRFVDGIGYYWGWLQYEKGLHKLGTVVPAGREVFGHRDFSATACPGEGMWNALPDIEIRLYEQPEALQEEHELELVQVPGPYVHITDWRERNYVTNMAFAKILQNKGKWPDTITPLSAGSPILAAFQRLPKGKSIPA